MEDLLVFAAFSGSPMDDVADAILLELLNTRSSVTGSTTTLSEQEGSSSEEGGLSMMGLSYQDLDMLYLCNVLKASEYLLFRELKRRERKSKKKAFQLSAIPNEQCRKLFCFDKTNIVQLYNALKIPETCRTSANHEFSGLEGLCILLARLSNPTTVETHVATFGRSVAIISRIFLWMLDFIYYNFAELLRGLDQKWMNRKNLEHFSQCCATAGCPLQNIAGFIDNYSRPICRPSRKHEAHSRGNKPHVIKYQAVILPNGHICRLDGAFHGNRHDNFVLNASGLLRDLARHWVMRGGASFRLYGLKSHNHARFLAVPYKTPVTPAHEAFDNKLNAVKQNDDFGFRKVIRLFPFVRKVKQNKMLPLSVNKTYIVAALLTNCHSCFYGNQVAGTFNCMPMPVYEYLG